MTHDELLAKISNEIDNGQGMMAVAILGDALRAVVELHKPYVAIVWKKGLLCEVCQEGNPPDSMSYPCPTIQVIEKELK